MDRKAGVKKKIKYQLNWIWTFLVKPVCRQASTKLAMVFFCLGRVFACGGCCFLILKPKGTKYTNEHQNLLVPGQEAFRESQAEKECIEFYFPIFVT